MMKDPSTTSHDNNAATTTAAAAARRTSFIRTEEISYPDRFCSILTIHPPKQRQRWTDTQVLPHVNWGDLFFDLFYVAAAYNLSGIITEAPNRLGIFYYLGCFGPIMSVWLQRTYFDARFAIDDDPCHRLLEVLLLCLLGNCVLHITTVEDMSHPSQQPDMMAFSFGLTLIQLGAVAKDVEVYLRVVGEETPARANAKRDIYQSSLQGFFYLAATIYAGVKFYNGGELVTTTSASENPLNRFLVGADAASTSATQEYYYEESHIPITLCLVGYLSGTLWSVLYVSLFLPQNGFHKDVSVPMNIGFTIHRIGEWTMLLLGESILSLLIVEVSDSIEYYVTFYAGLVSTILMQYLHYRSQPHHADQHAMRRSKNAGIFFNVMMQIYSFALVLIGVSFKMMLYEYTYKTNDSSTSSHNRRYQRLLGSAYSNVMRCLSGGGSALTVTTEERQQRVANIFCGSLAVAWMTLDLMILAHLGYEKNAERCRCNKSHSLRFKTILFGFFRVALVAFIATVSRYVHDPEKLAVIGLAGIVTQVVTRVIGDLVVPSSVAADNGHHGAPQGKAEEEKNSEEEHWPNVTYPVSLPFQPQEQEEESRDAHDVQMEKKLDETAGSSSEAVSLMA